MAVSGTNIGTVYDNDQGKGLAVTLDTADYYRNLALIGQQKSAAAKAKEAGAKALTEAAPEVKWAPYINRVQQEYENLLDESARVMAERGIDNIWASTDPEAQRLVKNFARMKGVATGINSLYADYQKRMEDINNNPDKYTQESIDSVLNFPDQLSGVTYEDIQRGSIMGEDGKIKPVAIPGLKFKHPSTLHDDFYIAGQKNLRALAGENGVVDPGKISNYTANYFLAEENRPNLQAQRQIYDALPQDGEMAKIARSEARAAGLGDNPEVGLAIYNMKMALSPDTPDIGKVAIKMADEAPMKEDFLEREDVSGKVAKTLREVLKNPDYPRERARSYLLANRWILERPDALVQLKVNPETAGDGVELFSAALDGLETIIRDNISSKYHSSIRFEGDNRYGKEELDANADDWQKRIWFGNAQIANEAVGWLKGEKMPGSTGIISDAEVIPAGSALMPFLPALPVQTKGVMKLTFKDEKTAQNARVNYYKELRKSIDKTGMTEEEATEAEKAQEGLLKQLDRMFKGNEVGIPLDDTNWQLLKNLHRQRVKSTGALYESRFPGQFQDRLQIHKADPLKLD